jgi:ABC-type transport system involved in multi-copper enzyme maturation permease subunit
MLDVVVRGSLLGALPPWMDPLKWVLLAAVAILAGLFLLYLAIKLAAGKVAAILLTTAKEALSQPLFYVALVLGGSLILLFVYIPYNTFGEDVKMLKDSGLTLITFLGILIALWTASLSVADEIEGRTALTLLSKPVGRTQFILGKFLGILAPVALLFVLLSVLFLACISYKLKYDARETSQQAPTAQQCQEEIVQIVPGLALAFLETVILTAISIAISTRLPMLANLTICLSIYALGHLVPLVANSDVGRFETVSFVAQLIAVILPNLDHFNVQAAVTNENMVSPTYLAWALAYCLLYSTFALLAALFLFEDRDLA